MEIEIFDNKKVKLYDKKVINEIVIVLSIITKMDRVYISTLYFFFENSKKLLTWCRIDDIK